MEKAYFVIAIVGGILIILLIFLIPFFKVFGKNYKSRPMVTLPPEISKIEPNEFQPGKFVVSPQEIEKLEKEIQLARDFQKMESVKEKILEKKEEIPEKKKEIPLNEPGETISRPIKENTVSQHVIPSNEDNEKLKLKDILVEKRNVKNKRKARMKRNSTKKHEKSEKLKEEVIPEKKPVKKPVMKQSNDQVIEGVLKGPEEKSPRKKMTRPNKKQAIANENTGSGEL